MRIAIISDVHMPAIANSAQEASFSWAINTVKQCGADMILAVGDLTASGDHLATQRALTLLKQPSLPFRSTAGNAEWRDQHDGAHSAKALTASEPYICEQCMVLLIDSSTACIDAAERQRIEQIMSQASHHNILLVTHMPPYALDENSRAWLENHIHDWPISLYLCGHGHCDHPFEFGNKPARMVCGLDPEKAYNGPPSLSWLTLSNDRWQYETTPFPGALLDHWTNDQKQEMVNRLGVSCVEPKQTLEHLDQIMDLHVPCLEVRAEAVELPGLDQAIARWRNTVDQTVLSVHLPNIYWNDGEQSEAERNLWIKTTQAANDLNTAQMTLHPPRLPMDVYRQDPDVIQRLADRVQPYLEKTTARIAVENLHMSPNQTVENREFGCLPDEVLSWREAIRERLGSQRVGNLLDLGHARANGPYSSTVGLGTWFTHLGTDIIGYHLHQLDPQSGAKRCHFPIDHIYGPGISYAAYFWAWQTGQISRCPIFLEVRGAEQRIASLQYLRRVLTENPV